MKGNGYKRFLPPQSIFSRRYACWANNHNGWSKMKKANKKIQKAKIKCFFIAEMAEMEADV